MKKQAPIAAKPLPNTIVLFDGVCNFCNRSVLFILKRDQHHYFRFAALQSPLAQNLIAVHWPKGKTIPDSILLWEGGKLYAASTAALRISRKLSGLWPLAACLLIIPQFLRDGVYNLVARNRYQWFGKKNSCRMEEAQKVKPYFLE